MSKLAVQFLDEGFHRVLFDAMPMPAFVVNKEMSIFDYNAAAARLLGKNRKFIIQRRSGAALNCVHSMEEPGGCGTTPSCRDCVVRQSVRTAAQGRRVTRQWAQMQLVRKGKTSRVKLRVSCQPFSYGRSSFVLLMLEGLND